jgi:aminoglycoside 6'-N-acetyltransferase I
MVDRRGLEVRDTGAAETRPMIAGLAVTRCTESDIPDWIELRHQLWPWNELLDHEDVRRILEQGATLAAFIARGPQGEALGFAEAALRTDYVNGCDSSPVLFLEGIFVRPGHRRRGIARALCDAVAGWGKGLGCIEFASDALLEDAQSHAFHGALGFTETDRVVYFRKPLTSESGAPAYYPAEDHP